MEISSMINLAKKEIKLADHMLYVTYPLVKDKKLLINIISHLVKGLDLIISAFLSHEHMYKRIKNVPVSTQVKTQFFLQRYSSFNLDKSILTLFDVQDIVKKSVKFEKDNSLVLVSPHYQVRKVSVTDIKKYLSLIKNLLPKIENAIRKKG